MQLTHINAILHGNFVRLNWGTGDFGEICSIIWDVSVPIWKDIRTKHLVVTTTRSADSKRAYYRQNGRLEGANKR